MGRYFDDGFAARVKLARQRTGLSQGQFAAKVGVSRESICNWERGNRQPHPGLVPEKVALVAGVRLPWLTTGEEPISEHDAPAADAGSAGRSDDPAD